MKSPDDARISYREEEAAYLTGLSTRTLQRLRKDGDGPPHFHVGRAVIYPAKELVEWMSSRVVSSRPVAAPVSSGRLESPGGEDASPPPPPLPPSPAPSPPYIPPPPPEPEVVDDVVAALPRRGGGEYLVHSSAVDAWMAAYPGLDVHREIAKAEVWLRDNPSKAKKDVRRFLGGWMSRAHQRLPAAQKRSTARLPASGISIFGQVWLPSEFDSLRSICYSLAELDDLVKRVHDAETFDELVKVALEIEALDATGGLDAIGGGR